jgi:hypothetical protein
MLNSDGVMLHLPNAGDVDTLHIYMNEGVANM